MSNNEVIGIKELAQKHNKTTGYFRTILCRPEFNKFNAPTPVGRQRSMFWYHNCDGFKKALDHIMTLKNTSNGRSCRGVY